MDSTLKNIKLIVEGFKCFNLLEVNGKFYGIPQGEGEFSLERIAKQDYSVFYTADNESTLRALILSDRVNEIQLIDEGYKGFNVLEVGGKFYAIPQGEGKFSLKRIEKQDYSVFYTADNEFTLRSQIKAICKDKSSNLTFDPATSISQSKPLFIDIEPAYGCNLRCRMCHVTYLKDQKPKFLDIQKIDWNFARDKEISLGSLFEPTINPTFNELIGCLNEQNARISLTTNALNLSRRTLGNLYKSKLNLVYFSFDGASKETYEYIRQRSRYESVISNIKNFIKQHQNSEATFIVNFTVCKYNMEEIIPAIDLWESLGVHVLGLIIMVSREKETFFVENSLVNDIAQYEKTLETAANHLIKKNYKIALSSPYFGKPEIKTKYRNYSIGSGLIVADKNEMRKHPPTSYSLHHYYGYGESLIPHQTCRSPLTTARIDYDGNVYICQTLKIGNLYENKFSEIWNSQKRQQIISQLIESPEQCQACDYFRFCLDSQSIDYEKQNNFTSQTLLRQRWDSRLKVLFKKGFNRILR
ncbi:MAG: radical SAM protein [Cyanobacteria bacterium SBLK]|nr:radical SAM protein [Cyanobacteria bacterium SBLK]